MLEAEARIADRLSALDPGNRVSARNLTHYLALRRFDLRRLQRRLAGLGVSSLGRAETHVLANLDKVLGILHRLIGEVWTPRNPEEPIGFRHGQALLEAHTAALLGPGRAGRRVRIMVTLPSAAARDQSLILNLVRAGMDVARINCAHDTAQDWLAMIRNVRRASRAAGRPVRILADLAGPKLRTRLSCPEPVALKIKPERNALGQVTVPAHVEMVACDSRVGWPNTQARLEVDPTWLRHLRAGDEVALRDARGARRRLKVTRRQGARVHLECMQSVYLLEGLPLQHRRGERSLGTTRLEKLPPRPSRVCLRRGETVRILRQAAAPAAREPRARAPGISAVIVCTLPEALDAVVVGQRVWFDDGRIGARVRRRTVRYIDVRITDAPEHGAWLGSDKGINFPDTDLDVHALSSEDIAALESVAPRVDMLGLSFAQSARDVHGLRKQLRRVGAGERGIILKVETRLGFERLPEMLLAAMQGPSVGVMIARGDLAVECGFERLAELQEEILWACEAAHVPVVWATQVLESLAKSGMPSRAEVTDAAMGVRAECVMLNKGPYVVAAVRVLEDILRRMQAHQSKKRPLMRALHAWSLPRARQRSE